MMRTLKFTLRMTLAGLMLTSGVALAAPADFTADVAVALAFVPKSATETDSTTITYGGTRQVKATLSVVPQANAFAQGITLDATVPAGLTVSAVSGCTPTGDTKFPCTVADLLDGDSTTVTVTLSQATPSPLPSVCGQTATYTDFSVAVTTGSVDPDAANNTAAVTPTGVALVFADLAVTFTGPETSAEGVDVSYHVTVTNNGPCDSANVWVYSDAYGSAPFVSATWSAICQNAGDDFELDGCQLGTLASGEFIEFDKVYSIPNMSSDATSLYHPNGVSLGGPTGALVTKDFSTSNNSDGLSTYVSQAAAGCSTAGAGGPTGLLALGTVLALVFRRRRAG